MCRIFIHTSHLLLYMDTGHIFSCYKRKVNFDSHMKNYSTYYIGKLEMIDINRFDTDYKN